MIYLNELLEHKNRQIDENRKVSKILEDISTRLIELEEWKRRDEDRIYDRLKSLQNQIDELVINK